MPVLRLTLTDFRSYRQATLTCGAGAVVLSGDNGAGKTNILEAISLLSPGRGLRQSTLSEMACDAGPGGFAVAAHLAGEIDIGTGTLATAPERRQVRINGAGSSAAALSERLAILWLTPAMDRIFVEGAVARRRFLDRLTIAREPGHGVHAARYEAAMRARNRLLSEEAGADAAWLAALEAGMVEHGLALAEARARTVAALTLRLADQPPGPFARAHLALDRWTPEDAPRFASDLRQGRGRDAAAGRTLTGPHRTDLVVRHLDKQQPADRCSTGEQKALLLSIVLAHADIVAEDRGARPILLLDEVAAHLDPSRRAALFARLDATGGQSWMTGTEPALFEGLGTCATRLTVAEGQVRPAQD
ncbi:DNA replication/repair protein RecF [Sphingomonas prati]|uniref:DNA replication and repair protein RecF n=1 Tax=Sphingomonas prati TaxID=1843237 RepID=A0A7W9BPZ4_9SPHN|nr:DNA replication/repair protein RecF [Sphingomonas prati]MBB5727978.1 DNA replication and repair protein RecF [Sphingomonas prati]GGE82361.1 DNA replication and repair protein RecF [Sphingomonas prati]